MNLKIRFSRRLNLWKIIRACELEFFYGDPLNLCYPPLNFLMSQPMLIVLSINSTFTFQMCSGSKNATENSSQIDMKQKIRDEITGASEKLVDDFVFSFEKLQHDGNFRGLLNHIVSEISLLEHKQRMQPGNYNCKSSILIPESRTLERDSS